MSNFRETKAAADKLGSFLELFVRAKSVLESAAQAEQQEQALLDRVKAAEVLAADADARAATSVAALDQANEKLDAARKAAADVEEQARKTAAGILADARKSADERIAAADAAEANAKRSVEEARAAIVVAVQAKELVEDEVQSIMARIEAAKAEARKLFGVE